MFIERQSIRKLIGNLLTARCLRCRYRRRRWSIRAGKANLATIMPNLFFRPRLSMGMNCSTGIRPEAQKLSKSFPLNLSISSNFLKNLIFVLHMHVFVLFCYHCTSITHISKEKKRKNL